MPVCAFVHQIRYEGGVIPRGTYMQLRGFQVFNFRNIIDSGWVRADKLAAIIAQNECGKSNLLEAFYKMNPFIVDDKYNISEDWPADKWGEDDEKSVVCKATFQLSLSEYKELIAASPIKLKEGEVAPAPVEFVEGAEALLVTIHRYYNSTSAVGFSAAVAKLIDTQTGAGWVLTHLPKFVFMQDYAFTGGSADLTHLSQRLASVGDNRSKLNHDEQTILTVLDLARIDVKDLHSKGNKNESRTNRGFDTIKASSYLTSQFAALWRQKAVKFMIRVDGPTLDIHVEDEGLGMPVRLERRSQGFRWYVSFIWKFSHASKGEFKNCILLLDEPGVHLHPAGQRDLLNFMERLSESNTVIYTTHLASMVDPAYPERIRIMEVRDHHATLHNGMYSRQPAPMMVIEQALGLSPSMSGLLGTRKTLIVEGGEDAIILQKLSGILERNGEAGLDERIYLLPANTASKTPMYAGFMIGQKLDAAVLLDSDVAGFEAKKKIENLFLKELAKDSDVKFRTLMIGDALAVAGEVAIEDLFSEEFFIECCSSAYKIVIEPKDLPTTTGMQICKKLDVVIRERNLGDSVNKKIVLQQILMRFEGMKTLKDLPKGTAEKAKKLIDKINGIFEDATQTKKTTRTGKAQVDQNLIQPML